MDKILIYASFQQFIVQRQNVNFLTNEILLTFLVANQKERKASDNVHVILNKIH